MVVLNILGKIQPVCVSQKLKLYVANLPRGDGRNWNSYLVEEIETALKLYDAQSEMYAKRYGKSNNRDIKTITQGIFPLLPIDDMTRQECIQHIADNMICIYFDYDLDDLADINWGSDCFVARFCEPDYADKIAYFIHLICDEDTHDRYPQIPPKVPHIIFTDELFGNDNNYRYIFNGTSEIEELLENLVAFGQLLDCFLVEENDYYVLDYLCNELYRIKEGCNSANHCQKLYSLCEFFLEKDTDRELDEKLPPFLAEWYSVEDRKKISRLARQVRNKVSHGDFAGFRVKIEEYAYEIMEKNDYWFDYSEYSRQNWAIMNLCCGLLKSVRYLTAATLTDRESIASIKNRKL